MDISSLSSTAKSLVDKKKGVLAADWSEGSATKYFDKYGIRSTEESRRQYRLMLFTTSGIEEFISGVILHDETIRQLADDGTPIAKVLSDRGIIPGIKVDKGAKDMANFPGEKITEGLDGLRERLIEYQTFGLKFTKWRALITIGEGMPTDSCIYSNAENLARFAALSQEADMVPIVEPEVLMEGAHSIETSKKVLKKVLKEVFIALSRHNVYPRGMLLKSSWVHPGLESKEKPDSMIIAKETIDVFREVLPDDLPGVVFLSGGDSPEDSTSHLDALNEIPHEPWKLSFSFGRALQESVLKLWAGRSENVEKAKKVFYERANLNSLATKGEY